MSFERKINLDQNLQFLIGKYQFSVSHTARLCNIHKSSLHNWVNGVLPTGLTPLVQISKYFNISLDELVFHHLHEEIKPVNCGDIKTQVSRFEVTVKKIV